MSISSGHAERFTITIPLYMNDYPYGGVCINMALLDPTPDFQAHLWPRCYGTLNTHLCMEAQ
jgi:hypothetical protein